MRWARLDHEYVRERHFHSGIAVGSTRIPPRKAPLKGRFPWALIDRASHGAFSMDRGLPMSTKTETLGKLICRIYPGAPHRNPSPSGSSPGPTSVWTTSRPNINFRTLCPLPIEAVACIFDPKNSVKILSVIHLQLPQIKIHRMSCELRKQQGMALPILGSMYFFVDLCPWKN